jgi:Putative zinc-finger
VTRCPDQVSVGAYVLDVLEPGERDRMQRHLRVCARCAADWEDLAPLPARLAAVPARDVLGPPRPVVPTRAAFRRLRVAARAVRERPRSRAIAAAAAVTVVGVGVAAVVLGTGETPPAPDVVTATAGALHASAALTPTHNGTRVVLSLGGVPAHERCRLVAVDRLGQRQTASTWTATYDGDASVTGWLSMRPGDIDHLVVETLDGTGLLTLPAPDG